MDMTRKEVKQILKDIGIENRFSLRTVNFPRRTRQVVTVKDWQPDAKAKEIESLFRGTGIIVDFEPAKGMAFFSSGGSFAR